MLARRFSAVFLDRDGTINKKRSDYVKSIREFIFLPNSQKAICEFNKLGYYVVIITNQSVVNRGIINKNQLNKIHNHMIKEIQLKKGKIKKIYFCPHRPDEDCVCRKPKPGLLLQAIKDFRIDIASSWLIGDSESDIETANFVGLKSIKIQENGNLMNTVRMIKKENAG